MRKRKLKRNTVSKKFCKLKCTSHFLYLEITKVLVMKLILIFITLILVEISSAEREYVKVNEFNVSFELNQTHDFKVNSDNGINGSIKINTSDGFLILTLSRDSTSAPKTWAQDFIRFLGTSWTELIEIDGGKGVLFSYPPKYLVLYYPDPKVGITIGSYGLPLNTTADFLRSIHVAI